MTVHCLFEQSGTFRDAFKKFGCEAYDYDIDNQFGKTDYQLDLFKEIQAGYNGEPSIFDNFKEDDLIIAFFPCIRFSAVIMKEFNNPNKVGIQQKLEYAKKLNKEQYEMFWLICDLFLLADARNLRLIVENPYTQPHFLTYYFPIKPKVIDMDRRVLGDKFMKPTQYWFVNMEPKNNKLHRPFEFGKKRTSLTIDNISKGLTRSLIEPEYAENFIKKYILDKKGVIV